MTLRDAYLSCARHTVDLSGRRELGERWDEPSVLDGMSIGALAAHLARSVLQVDLFLDMPEPEPPVMTAAEYYAALTGTSEAGSQLNVDIRERAEQTAGGGWARLYLDTSKAYERLVERLPSVPPARRVIAFGRALVIDEYLKTRLVELTIHLDDLSRSLGLPLAPLSTEATGHAISVLVEAACIRHGDLAVLRALARREQDTVEALRVL